MIVILTIKRRLHLAEATKQSLLDNGVNENQIEIIIGYDKLDYPDMKRPYHLVGKALMEIVIPYAIDNNTSIFYTECGTLFNENPFDLLVNKDKINWLGYIKKLKDYIIGAKLIYLPLPIMKHIIDKPPPLIRLGHIDRMIRNYALKYNCLEVADKTHISLMDYPSDWGTAEQLKRKKVLKKQIK